MRFSGFIWDNYLATTRGQWALEQVRIVWAGLENLGDPETNDGSPEEADQAEPADAVDDGEHDGATVDECAESPSDEDEEELPEQLWDFSRFEWAFALAARDAARGRTVETMEDAMQLYEELLHAGLTGPAEDGTTYTLGGPEKVEAWVGSICEISFGLFAAHPDWFIPYAFKFRFDELAAIASEFGLELPALPGKASWEDRARYYLQLNEQLLLLRDSLGLDTAELCALLYDFAPQHLRAQEDDLPEPARVWFMLGAPTDSEFLDNADETSTHYWQGNIEARRGDIAVMWCRSPRSYVHSIWRIVRDGFADPFFHYYNYSTVWIGAPARTEPVRFKEIQSDPVWSQKPSVRAHFQGASGQPVTAREYDALLKILENNGQDVSALPRPHVPDVPSPVELLNERDVEQHLLEPLLTELGYEASQWVRQLAVRFGRGERIYPDYAIDVAKRHDGHAARLVAEAKYRLNSQKAVRAAFTQAHSYALQLQSQAFILAAHEGVWTYVRGPRGFSWEPTLKSSWSELRDPDGFQRLAQLVGRSAIR